MSTLFDLPFEESREDPAGRPPAPDTVEPPKRRIYTVSELAAGLRTLLEATYPEIWVEGEISNCRIWNTGHLYFTLKDEAAQLKAVMFRTALRLLRFRPEDGLRVVARGRITVYEPKGEYQIVCEQMEPHGLGALQLAFDQLKKRLQAEGLFEAARKRALPVLPRKIGIVTSLDGAAIRDIIHVLGRRYPNAHLVIRPSRVQGEDAAADIATALCAIGNVPGVDVIIVGRGGGSIEDLWAFNEERVARAIARSPVPVVSAVGHETDVTIADFVADVRAPTPSAAAEMVVARKDEFCAGIDRLAQRLRAAERQRVSRLRVRLHQLTARPGYAGFKGRVALRGRRIADLDHELKRQLLSALARRSRRLQAARLKLEAHDLRRRLGRLRRSLMTADAGLGAAMGKRRHAAELALHRAAGRLEALSPLGVLARGYAVCWNAERSAIVRESSQVRRGERVRVTLHRGELECTVEEKDEKD
ncbi:MAG: exodeoxyribonuclease VII large subunit [Acidobacteria bacterium]|nr:exodeoxyribonuclease VII large subunit [Acidobacteriota bacterium]